MADAEKEQPAVVSGWAHFLYQYGGYLALAVALVATLGSLYFSEVAGFIPCKLCWYQRILMYPLVVITLVGIIQRDDYLPNYVLPFSIIGACLSLYHYLLQTTNIFSGGAGCEVGIPCSLRYINWLGFITISFLALIAFIMITVILGATKWAASQVDSEE